MSITISKFTVCCHFISSLQNLSLGGNSLEIAILGGFYWSALCRIAVTLVVSSSSSCDTLSTTTSTHSMCQFWERCEQGASQQFLIRRHSRLSVGGNCRNSSLTDGSLVRHIIALIDSLYIYHDRCLSCFVLC